MSFCNEHGIPHSEFLGWDPEDRAKALAFVFEKSMRCELCGTAEWEWDADRRAYEPVEKICMGCYLKHMAEEGGGLMPGTSIVMEPTRTRAAAQRHRKMKRDAVNG
jgi:hypothetical protein